MKTRGCPVDAACAPLKGWETFLDHIYREHTEGSEEERRAAVQAHLERGPADQGGPTT